MVYRVPGGEKPQECDFYWSMYHDRLHNTFVDSFEEAPPSQALQAASKGPRVSCAHAAGAYSRVIWQKRLAMQSVWQRQSKQD